MKKIILTVLFGITLTAAAYLPKFRGYPIVGGTEVANGEFPFIISLQAPPSYGHFCGGSLIKADWVLTAAHCVVDTFPANKLRVVIGLNKLDQTKDSETFEVSQVIVHPSNDPKTTDYDYALLHLKGKSKFKPVALNEDEIKIPESEGSAPMSITLGWGTLSEHGDVSNQLMKVSIPLVSEKNCEAAYPNLITDRMICAGYQKGGKDSCQGDSGGPLLVNGELAGVVSWGEGCARAGKPGIYSKVNVAYEWVKKTAGL